VTGAPWIPSPGGVTLDVRLTPRGGRDAIDGIARLADGRVVLKARVRTAPVEGEANTALCRLLAQALGVRPRHVTLAAGATARVKRIRIQGDGEAIVAGLERLAKVEA